eukprot:scaffold1298_cov382-Prasinococcus_capsulatus_cf.AAC.12
MRQVELKPEHAASFADSLLSLSKEHHLLPVLPYAASTDAPFLFMQGETAGYIQPALLAGYNRVTRPHAGWRERALVCSRVPRRRSLVRCSHVRTPLVAPSLSKAVRDSCDARPR